MALVFGRISHPPYEKHIVEKPWEGAGFDRVRPRQIIGMCQHRWWGYGDKLSLVRLFGTGGERQADALTDFSLTLKGELVMLNEPEGSRSPWSNGGSDGLEGDGALFVRKCGVSSINSRLISCEFEGKVEPLSAAQMEVGSSLWAHWFDRVGVAWDSYPLNPAVGCVTDMQHWEFATKDCPFSGARAQTNDFQDLVRGKMKAAQTGQPSGAQPPPTPTSPDHTWLPDGLTEAQVRDLFGTGVRTNLDGSTTPFSFDPAGVISNAWLHRAAKDHAYPGVRQWWRLRDPTAGGVRDLVRFDAGWLLSGESNNRATWKWL